MRALVALAALTLVLAGCSDAGSPPPPTTAPPAPDTMEIAGTVQGPGLLPIEGALVQVVGLARNDTTDAEGGFLLQDLPRAIHLLEVGADGFLPASVRVDPATGLGPLVVALDPRPETLPFNETLHQEGILQCALELLIMSGSCDALLTFAGQDPVLGQNASWDFAVRPGWRTLVLDVVFDPDAQPGLDGLRVVLRGPAADAQAGAYEQYGRFNGSAPYTVRVEPGGEYPDGIAPVPLNATVFRIDAYPHSHGWHSLCDPATGTCFLGAGAGLDVAFDLYVTTFYNAPAPEGWTLREA